jgi:hypothetical protein
MISIPDSFAQFIHGATMFANVLVALYFLRFWFESQDRLFAIFSLSFLIFAVNRVLLSILDVEDEARTFVYVLRLIGFLLIIIGIVDKNRGGVGSSSSD